METKENNLIYSERTNKNQQFDKRLIEHIVGLVEQGVPRRSLVADYGISPKTLSNWLSLYGQSKSRKLFTRSQKRSVVRAIDEGMSFREAEVAFGIHRTTIKDWIRKFADENTELSLEIPLVMPKKTSKLTDGEEVEALKKALEEANLKNKALNTLIDIAEERLKIDIRKKSGAKQSSK